MKTKHSLMYIVMIVLLTIGFTQKAEAQGCASVTVKYAWDRLSGGRTVIDTMNFDTNDRRNGWQLTCQHPNLRILADVFCPGTPDFNTGYYTFERIPYDPPTAFNAGEQIYLPRDDCWSRIFQFDYYFPPDPDGIIPPFRFHFWDDTYGTIVANSNGGVVMYDVNNPTVSGLSFTSPTPQNQQSTYCPYATTSPLPSSTNTLSGAMLNSINTPFQDILFSTSSADATMHINMTGEYPCRKCIFSYYNVPMYGYVETRHTSMVVLYETTNVIEFYIQHKPLSTGTNGSNAVLGIQNIDGTRAVTITNDRYDPENTGTYTTKSYNSTTWQADNEAWRIKPTGVLSSNTTIYAINSHGDTIPVRYSDGYYIAEPTQDDGPTWYYTQANIIRDEDGIEFPVYDSILVKPLDVPTIRNYKREVSSTLGPADSNSFMMIASGNTVNMEIHGGDEYWLYDPALAEPNIIRDSVAHFTVNPNNQPLDPDRNAVKYLYRVINLNPLNNDTICDRYDSVYIATSSFRVYIGEDQTICKGQEIEYSVHFVDANAPQTDDQYTFEWYYGIYQKGQTDTLNISAGEVYPDTISMIKFTPDHSDRLKVVVRNSYGYATMDTVYVTIKPLPKLHIDGNRDVCKGQPTTLTVVSENSQDNNYSWYKDDIETDPLENIATIIAAPNESTNYIAKVSYSAANCTSYDTVNINVVQYPDIQCDADQRVCEGELSEITVLGQADRYVWSSLDLSIDGATGQHYEVAPEGTTLYTVHAYNNDSLQCHSTDSMIVYVARKPVIALNYSPAYIDELTPQVVFADSTQGLRERLWTLSDDYQTDEKVFIHNFDLDDTATAYHVTLTGTTPDNCVDSASIDLMVKRDHHVWAPTGVYLHDANYANRTFSVKIDNLKEYSLKIFDKWGTVVFESNDPEQVWDCTYKDKTVPQGVYTWIARYRHTDSPKREMKKSGTFMIYN